MMHFLFVWKSIVCLLKAMSFLNHLLIYVARIIHLLSQVVITRSVSVLLAKLLEAIPTHSSLFNSVRDLIRRENTEGLSLTNDMFLLNDAKMSPNFSRNEYGSISFEITILRSIPPSGKCWDFCIWD